MRWESRPKPSDRATRTYRKMAPRCSTRERRSAISRTECIFDIPLAPSCDSARAPSRSSARARSPAAGSFLSFSLMAPRRYPSAAASQTAWLWSARATQLAWEPQPSAPAMSPVQEHRPSVRATRPGPASPPRTKVARRALWSMAGWPLAQRYRSGPPARSGQSPGPVESTQTRPPPARPRVLDAFACNAPTQEHESLVEISAAWNPRAFKWLGRNRMRI